jgi:hypothetical protein
VLGNDREHDRRATGGISVDVPTGAWGTERNGGGEVKHKIPELGYDVEIPDGWRLVTDNGALPDDLAWGKFDHKFTPVTPEEVDNNWDWFWCLIREGAK